MNAKILNLSLQNRIGIITINRPEVLNALNSQFFNEFTDLINQISKRTDIDVLIITGTGKAFIAGADIAEMVNMTQDEAFEYSRKGQVAFSLLEELSIPVIAAVNGYALGGGFELALACDIRIASEHAKFGQPEVKLGLIPGFGATQRLPELIGINNALFMLLSGENITAADAYRMGVVQLITEPEKLMEACIELAKKITMNGPRAVKLAKTVTRKGARLDFKKGCDLESMEFKSLFGNEGAIGMKAFLEKKNPVWK